MVTGMHYHSSCLCNCVICVSVVSFLFPVSLHVTRLHCVSVKCSLPAVFEHLSILWNHKWTHCLSVMMCVADMALAKQRLVTDETTESDVDSDADDSLSFDSSPFASPRQLRNQALISSVSAVELASMVDDDSNGQFVCLLTDFL